MLRLPKLLMRIFAIALQRELSHRANLIAQALTTTTGIAAGAATLLIVYHHVETLAGWRLHETLVLLGAYHVVSGLFQTFVEPNLVWFAAKVLRGELDDLLLQPVPSLFMASFGRAHPWSLAEVLLGLVVVVLGVAGPGAAITVLNAAACALLLAAGVAITWAARVMLASLAFWAPGIEPTVLYSAFWQLGRYPVTIYHQLVRRFLTYVVPVAFIATIPARALTRGVDLSLLATGLGAAVVAVVLARLAWHAGLRRYTSATS